MGNVERGKAMGFKEFKMVKRVSLGVMAVLLCIAAVSQAQDSGLHGNVSLAYQSSYIWRGFDVYGPGSHSAIQPSVDLNFFNTGFGLNVTGHRAISSGYEMAERWDYNPYYQNSLFNDEAYMTMYRIGYVYYNYPQNPWRWFDLQELHGILAWPKILGVKGLVPAYVLVKLWPSGSDSFVGANAPGCGTASGFAHIFMLDYALALPGFLPDTPEQILNLHAEAVYNDGVSPNGASDVDHDWSNAVFGVSTDFKLAQNLILTPGLFYQSSWEDTVNDEDETWVTVALKYTF